MKFWILSQYKIQALENQCGTCDLVIDDLLELVRFGRHHVRIVDDSLQVVRQILSEDITLKYKYRVSMDKINSLDDVQI